MVCNAIVPIWFHVVSLWNDLAYECTSIWIYVRSAHPSFGVLEIISHHSHWLLVLLLICCCLNQKYFQIKTKLICDLLIFDFLLTNFMRNLFLNGRISADCQDWSYHIVYIWQRSQSFSCTKDNRIHLHNNWFRFFFLLLYQIALFEVSTIPNIGSDHEFKHTIHL